MDASAERLDDLITRHLECGLDSGEQRELASLLNASPAARATLAAYLRLEGAAAVLRSFNSLEKGSSQRGLEAPMRTVPIAKVESARRRPFAGWAVAASVALIACMAFYFSATTEKPLGTLRDVHGTVTLVRGTSQHAASNGDSFFAADQVRVAAASTATLTYAGEATTLTLSQGTTLVLDEGQKGKRLDLKAGALHATVAPQPAGQTLLFVTANAHAEVLGTRLALSFGDLGTRLEVSEGRVRFVSGLESVHVAAQQFAHARPGTKLSVQPVPGIAGAAPPLPPPSGTVVRVASVEALTAAVRALKSGTTILIEPGTYALSSTLNIDGVNNVALRGASGNCNEVILLGRGAARGEPEQGIQILNAQDVLISDLSLGDFSDHPLHLHGAHGCARTRLYNLRCFDAATNFIHATDAGPNRGGVVDAVVEYCRFEYTKAAATREFVACINIQNGRNWIVRYCSFRDLPFRQIARDHVPAAILAGDGAVNTLCENNTFVNCCRAIMYGVEPRNGYRDHVGGIIRNNRIYRDARVPGDAGILIWDSPKTQVLHNTILLNGTYTNAIEYRFAGTDDARILNNLCDSAIASRDGAQATLGGNITVAQPSWFTEPGKGTLRLRADASAVDDGVRSEDAPFDFEGQPRPIGQGPDVGADEVLPEK